MANPQFGIVMFENGSRTSAMAQAKFASLDAAYASYRAHEGTSKPSLPDYLALTSGQYSGKGSFGGSPTGADAGSVGFAGSTANILSQLATAGFSWKTYEEGVAVNGYSHWGTSGDGNYATALYLARHCPAAFYTTTSSAGTSHGTGRYDFDELATDVAGKTLPDFFIITPNAVHDGHDSGFAPANTWLTSGGGWAGIDNLIAAMRPGGLLAITFDNVPIADTTTPITGSGIVYLVVAGPGITHTASSTSSNHFSLLKAIQGFFGVATFSSGVDSNYTAATAVSLPSSGGGGGGGGGAGPAPLITVAYDNSTPRFVNPAGDQILLRGVNLLMSAPTSYGPIAQSMGLNMIRLVCNWSNFEATAPTGSGTNYSSYVHTLTASEVAALDSFGSYFASHGIYMLIDFAQAGWSPYFGGSGVPSWYYTDARFTRSQNNGSGWATAAQANAIAAFWTDATEKPMAQTLYNAWAAAMTTHVTSQSWSDHVVGTGIFNEPNPGGMSGSSASKTSTMQTWLATTVSAVRAIDPARAIFLMCHGGGQGYGTAVFTDAYGSIATMQSKNMVMEFHAYYTGGLPGKNASKAGDIGFAAPDNDDYFPTSDACHNTVAGSNYTGSLAGQLAYMSVPIAKAAAIGLPMFHGEFNARFDDPGRLAYHQHIQAAFDQNKMSGTIWKLGATPTDSLGLVTNGALNDMGLAAQKWFKATTFIIPGGGTGGGGSGPTNLAPPQLSTASLVDGQSVSILPGTWSGAASVTDVFQLSADGSTGWATVGGTGPSGSASIVKNIGNVTSTTNSTTLTITTTGAVAAGNHVIIKAYATGSATLTSISGGSLAWQVDVANGSASRTTNIASAYASGGLASGTTLTLTFSASVSRKIAVADEVTGLATSTWVDQTSSNTGSSTTPTSGALTTTSAGTFIVNATSVTPPSTSVTGSSWTVGSGYTAGHTAEVGLNTPFLAAWDESISKTTTGTYTPASTTSLGTVSWSAASVAYKVAASTNGSNGVFTVPNDASDDGQFLRVLETATDAQSNTATATSPVVGPIGAAGSIPVNTAAPTVDHTQVLAGSVITWTAGVWSNTPTSHTYLMQRRQTGSSTILSATSLSGATTYTTLTSDIGYDVRFEDVETNASGTADPAFSPWTTITNPPITTPIFPTITIATPPSDITIVAAQPHSYLVTGTATSDSAISVCFVNSQAVIVDPTTGSFAQTIVLTDGANLVTVVATDADGDTSTDTNTITLVEPSTGGGGDGGDGNVIEGSDLLRIMRELGQRGLE